MSIPLVRHTRRLFISIVLALATVPAVILATIDFQMAIIWLCFSLTGGAYAYYRDSVGQELLVALFFALFVTAYHPYVYVGQNVIVGHINIYPLFAWTASLVLLRELYERVHSRYRFILMSVAYIITLFAVEYIGFYLLGIRLADHEPSLWGLGIMHGTSFLHYFYLLAGPLYLATTDYLHVR